MPTEMTNMVQVWTDSSGRPAKTKFMVPRTATIAAMNTLWNTFAPILDGVSDCGEVKVEASVPLLETPTAATAEAGTGTSLDKVIWTWLDSAGNEVRFETPAPITGQILANGIQIDLTSANVLAFIAAVVGNFYSPYNVAIASLKSAIRLFKNRKAKNL